MSKILINTTPGTVFINDTGVSIPTASSYTIPPQDYLLWAASSDVVTVVGDEDIVVNDGSFDLNISDGIDLIKGLFPRSITTTPSGTISSAFNAISAVASGISTEVITYTATDGDRLVGVEFSGSNIAKFDLEIAGSPSAQYYTHFGNLNGQNSFSDGLELVSGNVVRLTVVHNRPSLGDFSAKITILGA